MKNIILALSIGAILFMAFYLFLKKSKKRQHTSHTHIDLKKEPFSKKRNPKKYLYTLLEIIICTIVLGVVNPFVEFLYNQKYAILKANDPRIFNIDYFYPPERRMEDKVLLYVALITLIICYYAFKYTLSIVAKTTDKQTLSKVIRIRMLLIAFAFLASFMILLPLDLPDLVLGFCLVSSFIPLIIILVNVSAVGINTELNTQKVLFQSFIIFITTPIFCYGLLRIAIALNPFLGSWALIALNIPFQICFYIFLYTFSSFRNLEKNGKRLDDYF